MKRTVPPASGGLAAGLLFALALTPGTPWPAAAEAEDNCIACHRDAKLLVTNRKLYDYYRNWQRSIHAQESVSCADCHGGNPEAATREESHRGVGGESSTSSAVNFANVPVTCGGCHGDVEEAYRESAHFEHLMKAEDGKQGPNCVTCHDSMSTLTLDVTTVGQTCLHCHNDESGNHPEIPDEARMALGRFLSIERFRRYVVRRADSAETGLFLEGIDARRGDLSILWHTLDLERIDAETVGILDALREKRDEIRAVKKTDG